jgi:hypothetical protein
VISPKSMRFISLIAGMLVVVSPAIAQINPSDPLARMRAAAAANGDSQVCSVSETSACAQANPKILANALGSTVLAENLRQLSAKGTGATGTPGIDRVAWAMAAFRAAGAETVSTEAGPADPALAAVQNVVAEIRGREKPGEFVVVAANLDSSSAAGVSLPDDGCNAAMLVEAARDIHLTGLRPRRSIRFVLFGSGRLGTWAYVRKHRAELDGALAAVIFEGGCPGITGFSLAGREELEPGVRAALDFAPLKPWGIDKDTHDTPAPGDYLDFLLEGVPALTANRAASTPKIDLDTLKKDAAIAGVLAFGLAEHAAPLGPRLSRTEIASLLDRTGLKVQMQSMAETDFAGTPPIPEMTLWRLWESGERGRKP